MKDPLCETAGIWNGLSVTGVEWGMRLSRVAGRRKRAILSPLESLGFNQGIWGLST
jgi:hypothetical protein